MLLSAQSTYLLIKNIKDLPSNFIHNISRLKINEKYIIICEFN